MISSANKCFKEFIPMQCTAFPCQTLSMHPVAVECAIISIGHECRRHAGGQTAKGKSASGRHGGTLAFWLGSRGKRRKGAQKIFDRLQNIHSGKLLYNLSSLLRKISLSPVHRSLLLPNQNARVPSSVIGSDNLISVTRYIASSSAAHSPLVRLSPCV